MLPVGSAPFGGWRHHLPSHFVVGLWMLGSGIKVSLWQQRRENHTTGLRPEENKPTALSGDGNAPLLPTAPPPEGEVLAPLCLEMLMSSEAESRANFPPPGWQRNWIRRGAKRPENPVTCFPLGEVPPQAGIGVHFHAPQARLYGFRCFRQRCLRKAAIKLIARRAIPQPSGQRPVKPKNLKNPRGEAPSTFPAESFEPSEPGPQSGPFTAEPSCDTMKPTDGDGVRRAISCFRRMLLGKH